MKWKVAGFVALGAACLGALGVAQQQKGPEFNPDALAIVDVLSRLEQAWNKGDGAAYAACFAEEGELVIPSGNRASGRRAIAGGQGLVLRTLYRDSRTTARLEGLRFVRADVAIALVNWEITVPQQKGSRKERTISSLTLSKAIDGRWQVDAMQVTSIHEPAARAGS